MSKEKGPKRKLSFWQALRGSRGLYRRLFGYVKPYRWRFIVGLLFGLLFGVVNSILPMVVAQVSTAIFNGAVFNPRTLLHHREMLTSGPRINSIALMCLLIPMVMITRSLLSFGNAYYMSWVSNRVVMDIRNELFAKMVRHSMDFFNRIRVGFLMSRIGNDTRSMQMALSTVSSDVFKQPITIIGAITALVLINWKFTLVTLVLFPVCLLPIRIFGRRARLAVQDEQAGMGQMTVTMQETFTGIRVIKSFVREEHQEKTFKRSTQEQFANAMRMVKSMEAVGPIVETIASLGIGLALFYVYVTRLPAGQFMGLICGIFLLYEPIKTLTKLHIVMQRSVGATTKIFGLLDSAPTVYDAPGAVDLTTSEGRIDFEHVTFRYISGVTDAVQDLNLQIEPGKTYALVGPSGAGKSTILSLILRLYDPTSGAVRIDGQDVRKLSQKSPKGYNTVIGDKGCLLSGGQQQRLAIARALLKDAPVLLLDEATSALDTESERQIQRALERLVAGRTVIAIAHRLSTILSADQIVVMELGRIKEIGTHAELLEKSGYYRRLYDLQFNRVTEETSEAKPQPDVLAEELV